MLTAAQDLKSEILFHPALNHPFLKRFAAGKLTLDQIRTFGLQHYQLVRIFTTYMTNLIARRPDWAEALRPVLDDEFGQYTLFRSHVHLYRNFLKALGLRDEDWGKVPLLPETRAFIDGHLTLTREGDVLTALGAVGPGHELSIPVMFESLVSGLRRSTSLGHELEYFTLHIEEDKEHAVAFDSLIAAHAGNEAARARVREGVLLSLELRTAFWGSLERAIFIE